MPDRLMTDPETLMSHPHVLIIDDESETVEEIASYLEYRGYTCQTASDGLEGLERVKCNREIGIVITDVRMPRLDGIGFLAGLAEVIPDDRPIEVLVMSGFREESIIAGVERAVPAQFVGKPIDLKELLSFIESIEGRILDHRESLVTPA